MKKAILCFSGLFVVFLMLGFWIYFKLTSQVLFGVLPLSIKEASSIEANEFLLKEHVVEIVNTKRARNYKNIDELNKVAAYINSEFEKNCPEVLIQEYDVGGEGYKNIVCLFGEEKDLLVVGAHYDVDGESVGADDNASGVAGLIELSRLLSEAEMSGGNIMLVAYSLEELPHFRTGNMGSFKHARDLRDRGVEVKSMISLEMIGYFSDKSESQKVPSRVLRLIYPDKGNFIAIIGRFGKDEFVKELRKTYERQADIQVRSLNAPEYLLEGYSSDQLNYWKFGYSAAVVTDTGPFRNKNYHKTSDVPETLDYKKMAYVVNGVYGFLLSGEKEIDLE